MSRILLATKRQSAKVFLYNRMFALILMTLMESSFVSWTSIRAAGEHFLQVPLGDLSPGLYFYALRTPDVRLTKKMIVH